MDDPRYTLIQISDPHIEDPGTRQRYGTDTAEALELALRRLEESTVRPDAVLFTGDLTEDGTPAQYRRFRSVVEPVAARLAVPFAYAMGNHDDRAAMRGVLLGDGSGSTDPVFQVVRVHGLRIVVLDSSVPGRAYGELSPDQLDRLRAELAEPAPDGTVVVLHHPPLPAVLPVAAAIPLRDRAGLGAVLAGSDARIVLAGHTHMTSAGALAGVPVWTPGALASTADALPPAGVGSRLVAAPTVARIDLFADSVIATAVPLDRGLIADFDGEATARTVARLRAELPAEPVGG
ncbi:metallophosphoesterase family protein [Pseudonocardia humida]|uniref:Metallophosphoesterase n=1 Tax=Pseudonocardia humida TaxID=2800819 RepID=A0ABT0ZS35_9PSEU|nr:metallophosphoesterase [Pseudonocardia humida]MCO1653526.1 metallophosphoesterase [Pseudonocardia humida]